MLKIMIVGASCSKNKGSAAMLVSTTTLLKELIHDDISFTVLSFRPKNDFIECAPYNLRVVDADPKIVRQFYRLFMATIWKFFNLNIIKKRLLNDNVSREYLDNGLVLDLQGDSYSDDYGFLGSLYGNMNIIMCKLLNKPIVIYAQSIGPFKSLFSKTLSKYCLNKVDLLIVRDELTYNYLIKLGVTNKIYLTADSAFLLKSESIENMQNIFLKEDIKLMNKPIIGMSVSGLIYNIEEKKVDTNNQTNMYIDIMANVADYLTNKYNASIIFIPHVTSDKDNIQNDDRLIAKKIYENIKDKKNVRLINGEYKPGELKRIIGNCDLFIGARMHANIAAVSMCVPTISIAYSHKTHGIMKMLGLEKYVIDVKTMDYNKFTVIIDDLWLNRNQIKNDLIINTKLIEEKSLYNGILVKNLVNSMNKMPVQS